MELNTVMQYATYALALIGVLAFIVAVIVQVVKEMPILERIPTSAVALVVSLIMCPVTMLALLSYYKQTVTWSYMVACIVAAFIVYLVATGGWDRIREIWDRTKYKADKTEE